MMIPEPISRLIPHSGSMSLIDELVRWDKRHLRCRTRSHQSPSNPLRDGGRLHAIHALEYAGQATALHGALLSGKDAKAPAPGLLVAVKDLELRVEELSAIHSPLEIEVTRLQGSAQDAIYGFEVTTAAEPLASGRLTIMMMADRHP